MNRKCVKSPTRTAFYALVVILSFASSLLSQPTPSNTSQRGVDPTMFLPGFMRESPEDQRRVDRVRVTIKEEKQAGKQMLDRYLAYLRDRDVKLIRRGEDVAYLQTLVDSLRRYMTNAKRYRSIRVLVADTEQKDARAFPGGTIVFSRGMLEFAQNEATVVGILAHELSHIDRGHQLDALRRQKLAQSALSSQQFDMRKFMSTGKLFISQFTRPFRPEQESQADSDAARWTYQAGYDPMQLARFFLRMNAENPQTATGLPGFLRSHPFNTDRFQAIEAQTERMLGKDPVELYVGVENWKRRIPKSKRVFEF